MKNIYVIDAGPLVSYFDKDQTHHRLVTNWFAEHAVGSQLLCTDAVITEVTHLLDYSVEIQTAFLLWAFKFLTQVPVPLTTYPTLVEWMRGYANIPMDFADATVLWVSAQHPRAKILTHDMRGFGVFRLPNSSHLKNKFPQVAEL
jgi:predicted nucleic acid-binding protein